MQIIGKAVLFDLDGTLVDSTPAVERAWVELAALAGFDLHSLVGMHGIPARQSISRLLGPARQDELERWIDWLLDKEVNSTEGTVAYAGAFELLAALDESGLQWGIVTSCQYPLAIARIHAAGLPVPELLVTADDVQHGKPAPDPYLLGAKLAGIAPQAAAVIEDAPAGIASGKSAGATVLAVVTTHQAHEVSEADHTFENLHSLQRWLFESYI